MLLMMDQHPQRGWRSRTRVLCAPRSGRRSLTATAVEGTRASAPSLLAATACREARPFIMRGQDQDWRKAATRQWAGRRRKVGIGPALNADGPCIDWPGYSLVLSLASFSRINVSISGAAARIRSHCSL